MIGSLENLGHHLLDGERFWQHSIHASIKGVLDLLTSCIGRDGDGSEVSRDPTLTLVGSDLPAAFKAIHNRHFPV